MESNNEDNSRIFDIIKKNEFLSSREKGILISRYGFDDGREKTLAEIAEKEKVSRERIRQIESRALEKLHASTAGGLERKILHFLINAGLENKEQILNAIGDGRLNPASPKCLRNYSWKTHAKLLLWLEKKPCQPTNN